MTQETGRIELFGRLSFRQGDRHLSHLRMQKAGILLAYLACHRQRPHDREELIELLWPGCVPETGRNRLSVTLSALRRQLEPPGVSPGSVLLTDRFSVQLNPAITTDVAEFEAALYSAFHGKETGSEGEARCLSLHRAMELYRGPFLPGCYEDWALTEQRRLVEMFTWALRQAAALQEETGNLEEAIRYARRAVAADLLHEEAHANLIRLYAAAGHPAEARRQYRELERLLRQELDESPSQETRDLLAEIQQRPPFARPRRQQDPVTPGSHLPQRGESDQDEQALPHILSLHGERREKGAPVVHLPLSFTRFFGREEEIARLCRLVAGDGFLVSGSQPTTLHPPETQNPKPKTLRQPPTPRLVTVTGTGGCGKTRLAIAVAQQVAGEFSGGVWFVSLADLAEARRIAGAIVSALNLPASANLEPLEQVVAFLNNRESRCLLALDNYEHLAVEGAHVVRTLLERVTLLTCLVTSRQPLNLEGERDFAMPPLPTPPVQYPAPGMEALKEFASIQLFVDRAQSLQCEFQLTEENAAAVAALCSRSEGIPLAIELAAGWARALTPAQMLTQWEHRFDFLVSRRKDIPPRHLSLRAAVEWSYRLLSLELKRFFVRLSVFRGGWTIEAAEGVCEEAQALEYLEQLRECSLVLAEERGAGMRFRMLETLREYGAAQLSLEERVAVMGQHRDFFLRLAEEAKPELTGAEQRRWLDVLETEHDNLRQAMTCCLEEAEGVEKGLRLGAALQRFWYTRGHLSEGRERLTALLSHPLAQEPTRARVDALNGAGVLAHIQGDYTAAPLLYKESLAIGQELGYRPGIALSLIGLGNAARHQGDYAAAHSLFEESLAILRELGDRHGISVALANLGGLAQYHGDYAAARSLFEESLAILRELGNKRGIAMSLMHLGNVAQEQGDYTAAPLLHRESLAIRQELGDRHGIALSLGDLGGVAQKQGDYAAARSLFEESLALRRELGDKWGIASLLNSLGTVAQEQSDYVAARIQYQESLALFQEVGDKQGMVYLLEAFAALAFVQEQTERAAHLWGAAEALRKEAGSPLPPSVRSRYDHKVAEVRATLGEEAFRKVWDEGHVMTMAQAIATALRG
jgi:predicted ATPase/DNA-binding SARP family transcriptional activator